MATFIIILTLFSVILGYIAGTIRALKTTRYDYDDGYLEGYNDAVDFMEEHQTPPDKAKELIDGLDELFDDQEETIIDCGEY